MPRRISDTRLAPGKRRHSLAVLKSLPETLERKREELDLLLMLGPATMTHYRHDKHLMQSDSGRIVATNGLFRFSLSGSTHLARVETTKPTALGFLRGSELVEKSLGHLAMPGSPKADITLQRSPSPGPIPQRSTVQFSGFTPVAEVKLTHLALWGRGGFPLAAPFNADYHDRVLCPRLGASGAA